MDRYRYVPGIGVALQGTDSMQDYEVSSMCCEKKWKVVRKDGGRDG